MSGSTLLLEKGAFPPGAQLSGKFPLIRAGCDGYWEFEPSLTLAQALRNLVNPKQPAVANGSVAMLADGVGLTGIAGYIDTRLRQGLDMTAMIVTKATGTIGNVAPNRAMAISNVTTRGVSLWQQGSTVVAAPASSLRGGAWIQNTDTVTPSFVSIGTTSATGAVADATAFNCLSISVKSGGFVQAWIHGTGERIRINTPYPAISDGNPYLLGCAYIAGYDTPQTQRLAQIWNRVPTDAELAEQYQAHKARLAPFGIAI